MRQESTVPEVRVFQSLMLASRMLGTSVNQMIDKEFGITWEEYSVLRALGSSSWKFLHMTELAAALGSSKSRTTHSVARQQSRGRLIRSACPKDARATHATLTEQGASLLREVDSAYETVVRSSLATPGIGMEQMVVLADVLQSLVHGLGSPAAKAGCTRRRLVHPDRAEAPQAALCVI